MKRHYLLLIAVFALSSLSAQMTGPLQRLTTSSDQLKALAATITVKDMRKHLTILSADDMEGRETGQPGQKRAAAYLKGEFQRLGLPAIGEDNGYYQTILFTRQKWDKIDLSLNGESLRHLWEYSSAPSQNAHREMTSISELTFLGYGIDDPAYSDYTGKDVKGKHLLIFAGEPKAKKGNYRISGNENLRLERV